MKRKGQRRTFPLIDGKDIKSILSGQWTEADAVNALLKIDESCNFLPKELYHILRTHQSCGYEKSKTAQFLGYMDNHTIGDKIDRAIEEFKNHAKNCLIITRYNESSQPPSNKKLA